jgi:hypothetical protein
VNLYVTKFNALYVTKLNAYWNGRGGFAAADGGAVQAVKQVLRADAGRLLEVKPQTVNNVGGCVTMS